MTAAHASAHMATAHAATHVAAATAASATPTLREARCGYRQWQNQRQGCRRGQFSQIAHRLDSIAITGKTT